MRNDPTSPDTRLADYLQGIVPATTDNLVELTLGGSLAAGRIWVLHSRLRYFDPEKRRSGLPQDVAALVEKLTADAVTVTLVNTNQLEPRTLDVQAGGYGEHQFTAVSANGKKTLLQSPVLTVRLAPGAGSRLTLSMNRYVNRPTLAQPWNRSLPESQ